MFCPYCTYFSDSNEHVIRFFWHTMYVDKINATFMMHCGQSQTNIIILWRCRNRKGWACAMSLIKFRVSFVPWERIWNMNGFTQLFFLQFFNILAILYTSVKLRNWQQKIAEMALVNKSMNQSKYCHLQPNDPCGEFLMFTYTKPVYVKKLYHLLSLNISVEGLLTKLHKKL